MIKNLSGGNQQNAILGRWLLRGGYIADPGSVEIALAGRVGRLRFVPDRSTRRTGPKPAQLRRGLRHSARGFCTPRRPGLPNPDAE